MAQKHPGRYLMKMILPDHDFLGSVCKQWEEAADLFYNSGIRTVKIRSGVVLEKSDSALSKLMTPGKFGFLIQTGNGLQYMPWIHINDLCNIYLKAIEDSEMGGAYNAVSPQQVTHSEFMHVLAKVMRLPVLPPVPGFLIRIALGEMSDVILKGSRISSEKIMNTGYSFLFRTLEDALYKDNQGINFRNIHPCLEMISSFAISTTSIVFPKTLIIPSFLKSDNVLMTLAVLIPM
jgi:uncharacterized protein (TIGR01777 family)